jgi:serine/threonine-protein kinase
MISQDLGKYTLLEHMGKGSVASVYRATDNEAGSVVAVKVFEPGERTSDVMRRLRDREVRMLVSVQHPNIVRFYGEGEAENCFYYTMELVENSLLQRMHEGDGFSLTDKVDLLRQAANALQAIHHQGIVHRDMKPGNILLDQDEHGAIHVKVTDLGIAKHVSETDVTQEYGKRRVPGTPKYLSPEQIQLRPVDGRADIFSLGVVAHEFLSGQPPLRASTSEEYLKGNLHAEPRPVHQVNPEVPPFISQLVAKMLAKDREERYDSDTLGRDLELTRQHLVSDAPLVEEANPASIFYMPPVPATEPPGKDEEVRDGIPVAAWLAAGAVVAAGVLCSFLLWPEAPAPPASLRPIDLSALPDRSADEALDEADADLKAGRHWQAFAALRGVDASGLAGDQRQRRLDLLGRAGGALAQADLQAGARMLDDDRFEEAEVVRERMQRLWPDAPAVAKLAALIAQRRAQADRDAGWQIWIGSVETLIRRREYPRVLDGAREQLDAAGLDEAKKRRARDIVVQVLTAWGDAVAAREPEPDAYKQYMKAVAEWKAQGALDEEFKDRSGKLHLRLGDFYRGKGDNAEAARRYELVIRRYPGDLADRAKRRLEEVEDALRREPLDAALLAGELAKNGFAGGLWQTETAPGGRQEVGEGGSLNIVQVGGGPVQRTTARETIRPIRAAGFTVSAAFKMPKVPEAAVGDTEAGIEIYDAGGRTVRLSFDGSRYNVFRKFRVPGGISVADAVGDEGTRWHTLTLAHEYGADRLVALVDGKQVWDRPGKRGAPSLGDFRLRVFVQVAGEGTCEAWFKDVVCRP